MGLFGRKKKEDEEPLEDLEAAPADEGQDPSSWALPADAAVAAGQEDTVEQDAVSGEAAMPGPQTAAGGAVSGAAAASPSAGLDAEPDAVAAAQAPEEPSAPEPEPQPAAEAQPDPEPQSAAAGAASAASDAASSAAGAASDAASSAAGAASGVFDNPTFEKRPELLVAGAFAGAFVAAQILKRLVDE